VEAGTPGEMHERLAELVGTWQGKATMWMAPDTDPIKSDYTATYATMMDGRYTKCEISGEMPGMGMFNGFGLYGFDNVTQKFQSTWIDNMGTGMMTGVGEIPSHSQALTWNYKYSCPLTGKPTTMREVETRKGDNAFMLEMFAIEPKSGREYKMMVIDFTRKTRAASVGSGG
jgi:hypothetical protein